MNENTPTRYRKKPVVVEAMRLPEAYAEGVDPSSDGYAKNRAWMAAYQWVEGNTLGGFEPMSRIEGRKPWPASGVTIDPRDGRMVIATLEGGHWVDLGDWIIRGVQGEFYPCKPGVFEATYEEVES